MEERPEHPFDELLNEDSLEDSLNGKIDTVKYNYSFLKLLYKAKWRKIISQREKLRQKGLTDAECASTAKICCEAIEIAGMINESLDKILPWEAYELWSVPDKDIEYIVGCSCDINLAKSRSEREEYKSWSSVFRMLRKSRPTSVYTVAAAKTLIDACDSLARFAGVEERLEVSEHKAKVERYLSLERELRHRYMPGLATLDSAMSKDPTSNIRFLTGIFADTGPAMIQSNNLARTITNTGIRNEDDIFALEDCYKENEEMLSVLYLLKENYLHARMSGKIDALLDYDHIRDDIIQTQCLIGELVRGAR